MFTNRANDGRNNIVGLMITKLRKAQRLSQRQLAEVLGEKQGLDIDKNAIQRIESGQRFVTDVEMIALSRYFEVTMEYLCGLED